MKLDQTCPHCGLTEAFGDYCTRCFKRTQPSWVHPPTRTTAQRASAERAKANLRKESSGVKP